MAYDVHSVIHRGEAAPSRTTLCTLESYAGVSRVNPEHARDLMGTHYHYRGNVSAYDWAVTPAELEEMFKHLLREQVRIGKGVRRFLLVELRPTSRQWRLIEYLVFSRGGWPSQAELARRLKVSPSAVSRMKALIERKIARLLGAPVRLVAFRTYLRKVHAIF